MLNRNSVFRRIAVITAVVFGLVQMPLAPAQAELIGTDSVVAQTQVQDARATVQGFMARDDVRAEFLRQGVNPTEADQRIGSLSDAEVLQLAQTIETAPAGGLIGLIIGAALLVFIVLLITDLLGFTSVFGFTNKGAARP